MNENKSYHHVEWSGYHFISLALIVLLAILSAVTVVVQGWHKALILGGFTLALAVYLKAQNTVPAAFNALLSFTMGINAGGWAWNLFTQVPGYDEVAHALGTLGAVLVAVWFGYRSNLSLLRQDFWVSVLAVVSLGIALGALWEIIEWLGYVLFSQPSQSVNDEISDLIADSIGALLAIPFLRWGLKKNFFS
ncbi:MAG TPA: hypothetical protein VF181_08010 [Balneolaceae bacterium]